MPPENGGYATAAYIVVAVIVSLYTVLLWRRGSASRPRPRD